MIKNRFIYKVKSLYFQMASGNFVIGESLSLEGFDKYVIPALKERDYFVQDKLVVFESDFSGKAILVSIVGKGKLEQVINDTLVETGKVIEKAEDERRKHGEKQPIAWQHEVSGFSHNEKQGEKTIPIYAGRFQTIGLYKADDTASQLFPAIAQKYLLKEIEKKAEEVSEQVKSLMNKRLSEL